MTQRSFTAACLVPLAFVTLAFLAFPLVKLVQCSAASQDGWAIYLQILQKPRYIQTVWGVGYVFVPD